MKRTKFLIFQMETDGISRKDIAATTGVSENTLNIYLAKTGKWRPEYEAWEREVLGDIQREVRLRIKKRVNEALTVQEILLTMIKSNPREAGRAARDFLDRAGLIKAPEKSIPDSEDLAERIFRSYEARSKQG